MIPFFLNLPYTAMGIFIGLISGLKNVNFNAKPLAIVIRIRKFWWEFGYIKNARAVAIGHVVLLGSNVEVGDLEHELVHVEQYQRAPIIHPFLYYLEMLRKGYKNNKYEVEAYDRAGNVYKEPLS